MGVTRRELTALIVILVVVVVGALVYRKFKSVVVPTPAPIATSNPQTVQSVEDKFKVQIPDNAISIDLTDVSGGTSVGLATKEIKGNQTVLTVLADLPDPAKNTFYQVWFG